MSRKFFICPKYSACSISSCDKSWRNHSKAFCSRFIQMKSTFFSLKSCPGSNPSDHLCLHLGQVLLDSQYLATEIIHRVKYESHDEPFPNYGAIKSVGRCFFNYIKFDDPRILKLQNCERARRANGFLRKCSHL